MDVGPFDEYAVCVHCNFDLVEKVPYTSTTYKVCFIPSHISPVIYKFTWQV